MLENPTTIQPHPGRPPAHLSVNFQQERPSPASSICSLKAQAARQSAPALRLSPVRQPLEESNESGESYDVPAEVWFDESNKNVGGRSALQVFDNEPPFFLQNQAISYPQYTGGSDIDELGNPPRSLDRNGSQAPLGCICGGTNGSSTDDYRSVIDDLTIQNKKLRERLRKYERSYGAHLEKDRLFEVKFHRLNPRKKRELEETLHAFASSLSKEESTTTTSSQAPPKETCQAEISLRHSSKNPSSTSTNSHLVDSAYASMSASGPTLSSAANHTVLDRQGGPVPSTSKMVKIQSFLDDIPQGLLPKHATVMTERGKKKLVVRRLEQLFTGKLKASHGPNSQPLQQQEVSNSAARDDRQAIKRRGQHVSAEGVREAHILDTEMESERTHLPKLLGESSVDSSTASQAGGVERNTGSPSLPDQRPTRPLDLDPDRAQVPAENIEYIRHLGISTPVMAREDFTDFIVDDNHGWVYLNLLINMAQLHIINVTPDFIRSAVTEFSTKFQLSPDGRKIRWRGDTEGTELSSDSGVDNGLRPSPNDSDSLDEGIQKKRKLDSTVQPGTTIQPNMHRGRFSAVPLNSLNRCQPNPAIERRHNLHYKPLFACRSSSEDDVMSLDFEESSSQGSYVPANDSGIGLISNGVRPRGQRSQSGAQSKRKRDDGAVIFYSGAHFYTDLSGDRDSIMTPLHACAVDIDGFSNRSHDALGCKQLQLPRPELSRTSSGSLFPFRPFKDYSICARPILGDEPRSQTPELSAEEETDLNFSPLWTSSAEQRVVGPIRLEACGLGGTRPADHFTYKVETRRRKLDPKSQLRFSKCSSSGTRSQKFLRVIPKSSLDLFKLSDEHAGMDPQLDHVTDRSPAAAQSTISIVKPLQTEIISTQYRDLEPSDLPPPATYHGPFSSSTEWSDDDSSADEDEDDDDEADATGIYPRAYFPVHTLTSASCFDLIDVDNSVGNNEFSSIDETDTSSIDILAHAREVDPDGVATQDREYEREVLLLPDEKSPATADSVAGNLSPLASL